MRCARLKASVTGQIVLEPKPRASRCPGPSDVPAPVPEYRVRIATFCPSSRRLAMSPPHERATSSGWGAMKTWVMAAGVYGSGKRRSGLPARLPDERDEHAGPIRPLSPLCPVTRHDEQLLLLPRTHRDDEP